MTMQENTINLDWRDLYWCVRRLPNQVANLLKEYGPRLFVAGGFIRACIAGEKVSDIDIMVGDAEFGKTVAKDFTIKHKLRLFESENAFTVLGLKLPVQFIHRWTYSTPEEVISSFDFTIAQAVFWHEKEQDGKPKWNGLAARTYYQDLAAKRLVYTAPRRKEEAGGSILRVLKFYQRGYRIPIDSFGLVIARLVGAVDFSRIDRGNENEVAVILAGLLREVDPLVDPENFAHFPSEKEITDTTEAENKKETDHAEG
jgi:hypothetical protein